MTQDPGLGHVASCFYSTLFHLVGGQWSRNIFDNKLRDFCEKALEQWDLCQETGCGINEVGPYRRHTHTLNVLELEMGSFTPLSFFYWISNLNDIFKIIDSHIEYKKREFFTRKAITSCMSKRQRK